MPVKSKSVTLKSGHVYPFVCLQIDIEGHSQLRDPERIVYAAKSRFHDQVQGIIATYRGIQLTYAGDGGAFLFPITEGEEYDDAVRAGFRLLDAMRSINQEIQETANLSEEFKVRISLDRGEATYDTNPGLITGRFLNHFLKHERDIGAVKAVTVTAEVFRQLSEPLRKRFGDVIPSVIFKDGIHRSNP